MVSTGCGFPPKSHFLHLNSKLGVLYIILDHLKKRMQWWSLLCILTVVKTILVWFRELSHETPSLLALTQARRSTIGHADLALLSSALGLSRPRLLKPFESGPRGEGGTSVYEREPRGSTSERGMSRLEEGEASGEMHGRGRCENYLDE